MQCILGQLKVAEQADQCREDAPRLRTIDGVHFLPHFFASVLCHDDGTLPRMALVFQLRRHALALKKLLPLFPC